MWVWNSAIFSFNEYENDKIDQSIKEGVNSIMLKLINIIAYLIELVYDLEILPLDNMTKNTGFKLCLRVDRLKGV